uniref:Uncharacterized protein n=1 Tax=Pyramimonas obovata TaxID=1411642 RepID=A0A7S0MTM7_9CHLO
MMREELYYYIGMMRDISGKHVVFVALGLSILIVLACFRGKDDKKPALAANVERAGPPVGVQEGALEQTCREKCGANCSRVSRIASSQRHSWYRCVGETGGDTPWKYRSCHFKNVCYNGNPQGSLTYFAHLNDDAVASEMSSGSMIPYEPVNEPVDPRSVVRKIEVEVVCGGIDERTVTWAHDDKNERVVTFGNDYFLPAVWTHLVMDNLLPMYKLLVLFGHAEAVVEPLWLNDPCPAWSYSGCNLSSPRFNHDWVSLLSDGKFELARLQDKYNQSTQENPVCFSDFMTGLSLFSDHGFGHSGHGRWLSTPANPLTRLPHNDWNVWGISDIMWRFRLFTMKRAGIANPSKVKPTDGTNDVAFVTKGEKSWSDNRIVLDEYVSYLNRTTAALPRNIRIQGPVTLESEELHQQMLFAATTKVIVTQYGSTSYCGIWLPPGGTLIILHTADTKFDFNMWTNLAYIHVKYILAENSTQSVTQAVLAGLWRYRQRNGS